MKYFKSYKNVFDVCCMQYINIITTRIKVNLSEIIGMSKIVENYINFLNIPPILL